MSSFRTSAQLLVILSLTLFCSGCYEDKTVQPQENTFVPVEPGERLQRICQVICLNSDDGSLTPMEQLQEKIGKQEYDKQIVSAKQKLEADSPNMKQLSESAKRFLELNQKIPPKTLEAMKKANIRNFSIFLVRLENNHYAIRTFEYIGANFANDWLDLSRSEDYKLWSDACEECQIPMGKQAEGGLVSWTLAGDEIVYLPLTADSSAFPEQSAGDASEPDSAPSELQEKAVPNEEAPSAFQPE